MCVCVCVCVCLCVCVCSCVTVYEVSMCDVCVPVPGTLTLWGVFFESI